MITADTFRKMALSYPETEEKPHFEKTSFRIVNRKNHSPQLDVAKKIAVLMLSPDDQSAFCAYDETVMYPVQGTWGKQGATYVALKKVKKEMLADAMTMAYYKSAPTKLSEKIRADFYEKYKD